MVSGLKCSSVLAHRFSILVLRSRVSNHLSFALGLLSVPGLPPSVHIRSWVLRRSGPLGLLLVLGHLTTQPGIKKSSAMLILIADALHLLRRA